MRNYRNRKRTAVATFAIASLIGGGLLAFSARAQPGPPDSSSSVSRQNDSVNVTAEHHYNSPAERAHDDLLITEVKSALARDGVTDNYPVAVDCDHGKILLSGVVKSAQAAQHAGDIAAAAQGVTGVKNQLTWH
ncbi:BON domain-containing protein [Candidatus Binatus sp.]|uniref:BON domain-containing protein n=1 Tax=Candidatus Binatus sp. TaxID=2811406 RepID=UPI002F939A84